METAVTSQEGRERFSKRVAAWYHSPNGDDATNVGVGRKTVNAVQNKSGGTSCLCPHGQLPARGEKTRIRESDEQFVVVENFLAGAR